MDSIISSDALHDNQLFDVATRLKELNIVAKDKLPATLKQALSLRVSSALQTTLDTVELIELFSQQVKPAIPMEGLSFRNSEYGITAAFGHKSQFHYQYKIQAHGETLGELQISRKWELTDQESTIFEYLLCSLVYPLRNALLYHQALMAAHKDALTGVYNRASFDESLHRECNLSKRHGRPLALIVLDIDHFKAINDQLGHASGDCAIRAIADITAEQIRNTDILFRFGGEEFVILLTDTNMDGALLLAERIRLSIENMQSKCVSGNPLHMTASLGVAQYDTNENGQSLFTRADHALYDAKHAGRNCIRQAAVFDSK
jgi:diguanylate cyclase (GGDEF)-like protein